MASERMHSKTNFMVSLALAIAITALPGISMAQEVEEKPSAGAMTLDFAIARPLGIAIFGIGTATFVATLPFSLLGGNVDEAGKKLVAGPAKEAFGRCLGCSHAKGESYGREMRSYE